jgi:hypothetical protein
MRPNRLVPVYKNVGVVGHEAISQGLQPVLGRLLQQKLQISLAIAILEEDVFTATAPLCQMEEP